MANVAQLCIYILTWNVGTHHPDNVNLNNALSMNNSTCCSQIYEMCMPDIYVITFQEVNTEVKQILQIFQDNPWTFKIGEHLNEKGYVKLSTKQMQGILINMWILPQHTYYIRNVETQRTRTGFGGFWGNKGAVSIRLSIYGIGLVFVAAHLAAHDERLRERVEDFNRIVDNHHYTIPNYRTIFDHDFVFWFGDLNFRLNYNDSVWKMVSAIEQGHLDYLFQYDQLLIVRETGNAFSLMDELRPTFPPTFKFIEGTSKYNIKRKPAWCDRILYRVKFDKYPDALLNLTQLNYKSHPNYKLSDHKPVSAEFKLSILTFSKTLQEFYKVTHGNANKPIILTICFLFTLFNVLNI